MKMTKCHFHNAYHGFVLSEKDSERKLLNFIEISPVPKKQAHRAMFDWENTSITKTTHKEWLFVIGDPNVGMAK